MPNNTFLYLFNRILRFALLCFILYLIFTNFGTFLMIIGAIFMIGFFAIYQLKKKLKTSGFHYQFNGQNFKQGAHQNFNFNDFQNFANQSSFSEVDDAKKFFGFTHSPTKEEIKKRYKELARKYHPDINEGDDTKMKELNHFRDVLIKTVE